MNQLRRLVNTTGIRATVPASLLWGRRGACGFGVFMYHRVAPRVRGLSAPTWNVTPERFESQLKHLLQRGFEPRRLNDLISDAAAGRAIPRHAFAVTFDDGYRCVLTAAAPILRRLRIPATVFLSTGLLDWPGRMPQDDWADAGHPNAPRDAYEALTMEEADELFADPWFDFGSHTHTHRDFRGRRDVFAKDLAASVDFLRNRWRLSEIPFSYPYGSSRDGYCTPELVDVVRHSGVTCGLTTDSRLVRPGAEDPFTWGRIIATDRDSGYVLASKLDDWYGGLRDLGKRCLTPPWWLGRSSG